MYCKNCNAFNADGSRFCASCGVPLTETPPQGTEAPPAEPYAAQQQAYPPPYAQQPYYAAQPPMEPTKPLSSVLPIVSLILGIVFADIFGILLGAFSLVNFNRYTAALRVGDIASAEAYKTKSRRLATIGIAVSVVLFVLAVIGAIVAFVFFGLRVVESGGLDSPLVQFNYGDFTTSPFDVPAMLHALF